VQDEDVLDTWFSSALWPFSTLGWPDKTPLLDSYYPTDTLSTDRGIIYFWVARMVMMGLKLIGQVPFSDVYIHGTILDEEGRKMSKSLGNGIDPLDIIEKYGADAMRFSLVVLSTEGQDLKLSESKFEMGRNFCNKLWNAARFAMMNLEGATDEEPADKHRSLADRWILNRLQHTINALIDAMDDYKFNNAAQTLYQFMWNDFCDWYLEASKLTFTSDVDPKERSASQATLKYVLITSIKLLHPFLPFITEELWQHVHGEGSVMVAEFPKRTGKIPFEKDAASFNIIREIITAIRNIRGEHNVKPAQKIKALVKTSSKAETKTVEEGGDYIAHLARLEELDIGTKLDVPKQAATAVAGKIDVYIPYEGLIDVEAERTRLTKEIGRAEGELEGVSRKLSNESFTSRAPADIVQKERERQKAAGEKLGKLKEALKKME